MRAKKRQQEQNKKQFRNTFFISRKFIKKQPKADPMLRTAIYESHEIENQSRRSVPTLIFSRSHL